MTESDSAAQQAALDAAMRAFDEANAAGEAVLAAGNDVTADDLSGLAEPFRQWRARVGQACTAVRRFCDLCGPDGPDPQLLDGATPARELWAAGVDTLTTGFSDHLARWDHEHLEALTDCRDTETSSDPALPVMSALARLAEYLTDRWQERSTEHLTSAFQDYQREHGGTIDTRSTITPGGGKRTAVSFTFDRDPAGSGQRPDGKPGWWTRLTTRTEQFREHGKLMRTYRTFALSLRPREQRELHDALETALAVWLGHDDEILRGPWYASYYITTLLQKLGHNAVHRVAEIEVRVPGDPTRVSWEWDATGLPPALIWLPDADEVIDLLGGTPWLEVGVRPQVITDIGPIDTGSVLSYTTETGRQVRYTIVDDVPCTGPHADHCAVIDRHITENLLRDRGIRRHQT